MRRILSLIVAAILLGEVGCQKKPESETETVTRVDGVPTVHNPAHPLRATCPWQYVEDLVISNEMAAPETSFTYPSDVAVDNRGKIYVTDFRQKVVQVFDANGHYRRTIGKPGEGPGEFSRPGSIALDADGNLMVYDVQLRRLSWFTTEGDFLRSVALDTLGWPAGVQAWTGGRFLVIMNRPNPDEPEARYYTIAVFDTAGRQVDSLGTFFGGKVKRIPIEGGVVTYFTGYEPSLAWAVGSGPILWLGYSGEYAISAYNRKGELVRRVQRSWEPARLSEEKRRKIREQFSHLPQQVRDQIPIPNTEPAYYDLFVDDLGYLWVQVADEPPYRFDVFEPEGRFLCTISLDCIPLAWSSGNLYGRRYDPGTGSTELVRLRRVSSD